MKKLVLLGIIIVSLVASAGTAMAVGNGRSGYNYKARIFVGTGYQWCEQKFGVTDPDECEDILGGPYGNDLLVMKWSKAWDDAVFGPDGVRNSGDELPWTCDAWEDNEWNGMFPGGSGETWHYKIVWVGPELEDSPCWKEGGYPIWGQFEVILSHGTAGGEHIWDAHAIPTGYGN